MRACVRQCVRQCVRERAGNNIVHVVECGQYACVREWACVLAWCVRVSCVAYAEYHTQISLTV